MKASKKMEPTESATNTSHRLAVDIDAFLQDYDQYEYWAHVGDKPEDAEANIADIENKIVNGDTKAMEDYLKKTNDLFVESEPYFKDKPTRVTRLLRRLSDAADFVDTQKETTA
jgi:hypothetical protein